MNARTLCAAGTVFKGNTTKEKLFYVEILFNAQFITLNLPIHLVVVDGFLRRINVRKKGKNMPVTMIGKRNANQKVGFGSGFDT